MSAVKRIDRFIKPLTQAGGQRMILTSGQVVKMATSSGERPMTTESIAPAQILSFLREILPPVHEAAVAGGRECRFDYDSPFGKVGVSLTHPGGQPSLVLSLGDGEAPVAAHARGAAAPAAAAPPKIRPGAPAIDTLFHLMIRENCSDLHLSSGNPPMYRKDGDIVALGDDRPLSPEEAKDLLFAITPRKYQEQFEATHDADFSYEIPDLARFRCNLFMDRIGPGGVFRTIPTKIPSAEDLGLSQGILSLCHLNKGLVVVTGPTGSGKSTTLAAMVDYINRNLNAHIITIEDPIEFVHENRKCLINQREVGNHTQGFKTALRAALREDPDIVLVGEMRDLETVAIAIETAETGHLVFGTLHTNTAPSTVDRMIDQFPTDRQEQIRTMLAESLKGVIAQTLLRRIGGGRTAAQEVLLVNSAVSNLIREGKTFQIQSIMQVGKGSGMICLNDALLELVKNKTVTPEEAYAKAIQKSEFKALLGRSNIRLEGVAGSAPVAAAAAAGQE